MLKIPLQLEKVLSGTVTSKLRFAVEVPEDFILKGRELKRLNNGKERKWERF